MSQAFTIQIATRLEMKVDKNQNNWTCKEWTNKIQDHINVVAENCIVVHLH